ncbi:hypothetical protein MC885_017797 [Smutsia gigantea]|nr:hypothetical protein MC885_017797 [Smutsia gigantea]
MPIDCELSSWSSWTTCDSCQKKRYRHASLLRPSQFYGEPCDFSDKEAEDCVTNRPCRSQVRCEGFVCAQTGRCVNRRLLCNGDNDCGDQSDEANCRRVYKKCQHEMDQYWAIGSLASGINLFTNSLEGPVLDHRYYAGACSPHYILNTRFRKPYNVESYTPQTQGKYEFALTEYESYSDFEHNITQTKTSMSSSSFGFKIPGIFELGINSASGNAKHFLSRIKRFSHTKSTFLHARSDLEVAHYKLKPRSLMLHYEFLQRVKQLPLEYGYGEYRDLFRDFGTHYITEAVLGGIYEYTLIMNKEAMERADHSLKDVRSCAMNGFKIGAAIEEVYVSLGVSVGSCQGILKEIKERNKRNTMVEDLVVLVRGGASEYITALAYKDLPTADLMQEWGDAVQYNPDIIKIKVEPLYELVTATDFAYSSTVRQNMKRALEEFQKEVSSCHCAPCQGNGVPVLKESHCDCICPAGSQGPACEITKHKRGMGYEEDPALCALPPPPDHWHPAPLYPSPVPTVYTDMTQQGHTESGLGPLKKCQALATQGAQTPAAGALKDGLPIVEAGPTAAGVEFHQVLIQGPAQVLAFDLHGPQASKALLHIPVLGLQFAQPRAEMEILQI